MKLKKPLPKLKTYSPKSQYDYFQEHGNVDFGLTYDDNHRFRGNLYRQVSGISLNFRLIRDDILDIDKLGAPEIFKSIATDYRQGFFLIVGPTGHG